MLFIYLLLQQFLTFVQVGVTFGILSSLLNSFMDSIAANVLVVIYALVI